MLNTRLIQKMKYITVFLILLLNSVYGYSNFENVPQFHHLDNNTYVEQLWGNFKENFNKTYVGHHDIQRKEAYIENLKIIHRHNEEAAKGLHSYTLKDNHLSDLTAHSYLQKMVKLIHSTHRKLPSEEIVGDFYHKYNKLPESIDWRDKGFRTPHYNQKDCGACYAFTVAHVISAQIFKQTNKVIPLSEQQLVDCSVQVGNFGCGGGSIRNTLRYLDRSGGIMTYKDYPYAAKQKRCQFRRDKSIANLTSWAILPARDERAMEAAVAKIGPIAASINASPQTFQLYHSGVYDDFSCSDNTVNHAMMVVGYTKDYWILKNWWGKHWGENGYMRLKRNKNRCGVANYAAYALV